MATRSIVAPLHGILGLLIIVAGCSRSDTPPSGDPASGDPNAVDPSPAAETADTASTPPAPIEPQSYETNADDLLAMRLDRSVAGDGWIRLFDGHTLFGWEIATAANFRIENQSIVVDAGSPGLICTSMPWQDYELTLQYQSDDNTNSGVFLRTSLQPQDPATECYEINIAPSSDDYPTGGIVGRHEPDNALESTSTDWHDMAISILGGQITVAIDGQNITTWTDENPLPAARIGLQYNTGRIAFRDIRLRPLGMKSLIDEDLSQWQQYPKMDGEFRFEDDAIKVIGGRTQLETRQSYGDFTLLSTYSLQDPDTNSGIFFRCIPSDEMMGYECQINDAVVDTNRLQPADTGTGGIFRRQPARIVPGDPGEQNTVLLNVRGLQMAAWVSGIQVSNWYDDRSQDENPRRGSRTEPGTIMIQGHDPATRATYHQFKIAP